MKRRTFLKNSSLATAGGLTMLHCPILFKDIPTSDVEKNDFKSSFVRISSKNPHYFELSNGVAYIPVGANICFSNDMRMDTMVSFIQKLAAHGGNFIRVWLSHPLFEFESAGGKGINEGALENVDKIFELAQKLNLKLKLCLHHFRYISSSPGMYDPPMLSVYYPKLSFGNSDLHKNNGGPFSSMTEYINSDAGRKMYLDRVEFFRKRYGDNPAVFGWELWNEMDAIDCKNIIEWNEYMLTEVHKKFPQNLVMQSLGSFDTEKKRQLSYRPINCLPSNDVAQIHRYLDQGASMDVCKGPMDILASDAIEELISYQIEKPSLLAEVGAVEPNHSGPSNLHALDKDGILLHDYLFAPFFSGSAGTGHSWNWDFYIDKNDLWYHFSRFSECIKGINPIEERFIPVKVLHSKLRIYLLAGSKTILAWCRDTESNWEFELVKGHSPNLMHDLSIDFTNLVPENQIKQVDIYDPWKNEWSTTGKENLIVLPDFKRSIIVKLTKK